MKLEDKKIDLDLDVSNFVKTIRTEEDGNDAIIYARAELDSDKLTFALEGTPKMLTALALAMLHNERVRPAFFGAFTKLLSDNKTDRNLFLGGLDIADNYMTEDGIDDEAALKDLDGRVVMMANRMNEGRVEGEGLLYCRAHNKGNKLEIGALVGDPTALGVGIKTEMENSEQFSHFFQQVVAIYLSERPSEYALFQHRMIEQIKFAEENNLIKE